MQVNRQQRTMDKGQLQSRKIYSYYSWRDILMSINTLLLVVFLLVIGITFLFVGRAMKRNIYANVSICTTLSTSMSDLRSRCATQSSWTQNMFAEDTHRFRSFSLGILERTNTCNFRWCLHISRRSDMAFSGIRLRLKTTKVMS